MFYNAVALALEGDPAYVRRVRKKCSATYGNLFGGWRMVYEMLPGLFAEEAMAATNAIRDIENGNVIRRKVIPDPELEWEKLEKAGVRLVFRDEDGYPPPLREIHNPPIAIYVRGELPQPTSGMPGSISIVGTRRATPEGKATTKKFARELAQAGFVIVSGLALGIDAAAHEGCLEGYGKAIAILAGGLNDIYPHQNERLGKTILERGGAFISEYPLGAPPLDYRFLERNRIVCGVSKGVLVVEAPQRSGSNATANFALQQNRDLFVVPGPITHPNFFGSHQLIRQGAELVTKPEEILEAYNLLAENKIRKKEPAGSNEEKLILIALQTISAPADVDKIIEMTKLEPRIVNQAISFLLLKELVKEMEAGYIIE